MTSASNRMAFLLLVVTAVFLASGCSTSTTMRFSSSVVPEEGGKYGAKLPAGQPSIWINHSGHSWSIPDSAEGFRRSELISSGPHSFFEGKWEYYDIFIDELARQLDSMGFTVVDSAAAELVLRVRGGRSYGGRGHRFPRDMNNIDHGRYTGVADRSYLDIRASLPPNNELRLSHYRSQVWQVNLSGLSGAIVERQFPEIVGAMLSVYGKTTDEDLSLRVYAAPKR